MANPHTTRQNQSQIRNRPKISTESIQIGKTGEDLAEQFLRAQNYKILTKNHRTKLGEIDIVAEKFGELIFIEVKTRTTKTYGLPEESITKQKLSRLHRLAQLYLIENKLENKSFRIDIISIQLGRTGKVTQIDQIKNI